MSTCTLVAVVVTYNRADQLEQTLNRLLAQSDAVLAGVVVCDNASTDQTADVLAARDDPRLHIVRPDKNLGGAGGFALGMTAAVAAFDPDWVVLMDDDARPEPGCFPAFHSSDRSGAGFWAAAVRYPSGRICDMNRPWRNPFASVKTFAKTILGGRGGFHLGPEGFDAKTDMLIDGASFVGLFLPAGVIRDHGGPDPNLFLYGDDVLYCLNLNHAGVHGRFDPGLRFEHDCETLDDARGVMTPLWKVYFYHRNQVLVYREAAGPVFFWPVMALRLVQWRLRASRYGDQRKAYLRLLRRAIRDGLAGRTNVSRDDL